MKISKAAPPTLGRHFSATWQARTAERMQLQTFPEALKMGQIQIRARLGTLRKWLTTLLLVFCVVSLADERPRVALIVPVTANGVDATRIEELPLFECLLQSLAATLMPSVRDKYRISLHLGYSKIKESYTTTASNKHESSFAVQTVFLETDVASLADMVRSVVPFVEQTTLSLLSRYEPNNIVQVWNCLVEEAFERLDPDYYFLLADDVVFLTIDWLPQILQSFNASNSPVVNLGVVLLRDETKPDSTSFAGFHRTHLSIFGSEDAIDTHFVNKMAGDWASDVYVSFGAAYAPELKVANVITSTATSGRYVSKPELLEQYAQRVEAGRQKVASYITLTDPSSQHVGQTERRRRSGYLRVKWRPQCPARLCEIYIIGGCPKMPRLAKENVGYCVAGECPKFPKIVKESACIKVNNTNGLAWAPALLAYGPEGLHYRELCSQRPGCVVPSSSESLLISDHLSRPLLSSVTRTASPPPQLHPLDVSLLILTWKGSLSLQNSLSSYKHFELFGIARETLLYFQEWSKEKMQSVAAYPEVRAIGSVENVGLGMALDDLVDAAVGEYVLFLEKDWQLLFPKSVVDEELRHCIHLVDSKKADICRLRSRFYPGKPLHAERIKTRENIYLTEEPGVMCNLHHWSKDPAIEWPSIFSLCEPGTLNHTLCSSSFHCGWSNGPFLTTRRFWAEVVKPVVADMRRFFRDTRDVKLVNLEEWMSRGSSRWASANYTVALGAGLFSHREIDS